MISHISTKTGDRRRNTVSDFCVASDQDLTISRVTVSRQKGACRFLLTEMTVTKDYTDVIQSGHNNVSCP